LAERVLVLAPNSQVYFSWVSAVYLEEVVTRSALDVDLAMLHGPEMLKVRPHLDPRNLVDVKCIEGIPPLPAFEMALLWQPYDLDRKNISI
jgi:hypothetical protein